MAQYRLLMNTLVAWAAGTKASPITLASYPVLDPTRLIERTQMIAGSELVGAEHPGRSLAGARMAQIEFGCRLTDSPTDDAPYHGAPLRACGMSEALGGTTPNIAYLYTASRNLHLVDENTPGDTDPLDIYINEDGEQRGLLDCVGNVVFSADPENALLARFSMMGLLDDGIADATTCGAEETAAAALTEPNTPIAAYGQGITVQIASASALTDLVIRQWEINLNRAAKVTKDTNGTFGYSRPYLGSQTAAPTLTFPVLRRELTNYNWYNALLNGDKITFKGIHNPDGGMGKTITYGFRGYLSQDPNPTEIDGDAVVTLTLQQSLTAADAFYIGWKSTTDHSYPF